MCRVEVAEGETVEVGQEAKLHLLMREVYLAKNLVIIQNIMFVLIHLLSLKLRVLAVNSTSL